MLVTEVPLRTPLKKINNAWHFDANPEAKTEVFVYNVMLCIWSDMKIIICIDPKPDHHLSLPSVDGR